MTEKFPAQAYRDNVLADCFADAKHYFLTHYLDVDRAHAVMLAEQEIITRGELRALLEAIEGLDLDDIRSARYDGSVEDLFFFLQSRIASACGDADTAGKLHTARSRNDIDVTIYRLYLRDKALGLIDACDHLRTVFLDLIEKHHESLMPAYTHTQPAQPTTIAHFLLAMAENMARDVRRLQCAYDNLNLCPLGACAITTTGFAIDRHRTAELLGFDGPTRNSYGSIASVDYFTELLGSTATLLVNIGRFAQEFLLMTMMEFNALRLPDGYVQSSSIMPQKRNPVAIEHVRAIASKALGQSLGVLTSVHNTPFGDINDVEDDLQPLNFSAIRDAIRAVSLLANALAAAEFNLDGLNAKAQANYITVTELADMMVRQDGLPFSTAHAIVAACVGEAQDSGTISYATLQSQAEHRTGKRLSLSQDDLRRALSAENFVAVRTVYGGPAASETRDALKSARIVEDEDKAWIAEKRRNLVNGSELLRAAISAAI